MKIIKTLLFFFLTVVLFSSCATIFGGTTYNAHIMIQGSSDAKIKYNGYYVGKGSAVFPVKRKDANKVTISVQEDGCEEQTFRYQTRGFRGWAFAGTVVGWTGLRVNTPSNSVYLPIPFGAIVDFATGAIWKPGHEPGIVKLNYNNFRYLINYDCDCGKTSTNVVKELPATETPKNSETPKTRPLSIPAGSLVDVLYLNNNKIVKGIIVEQVPNKYVKIQTLDNETYIFVMDDIERMTKEVLE